MAPLRGRPGWNAPSGHPRALAQGLWAGAAAAAAVVAAGLAGNWGMAAAVFLTAVPAGALVPLATLDILATRQASHPWLSRAMATLAVAALAWSIVDLALPSGLPLSLPAPASDEQEVAAPTLAGLLFGAERMASRGRPAWRDRALGAAAGYAAVAGVFLFHLDWLSWAVLLAALPLRLPPPARLAFAALSGAAALGLGQFVEGRWAARLLEAAAFAAYAAASVALARLRPAAPPPPATAPGPAGLRSQADGADP